LRSHKLNGVMHILYPHIFYEGLGPLSSYFLVTKFLDLKRIERLQITCTILTPSWSNIIIFQSISDIIVCFSMCSLICLVWIYTVTIQKKLIQLIKMLAFYSILSKFLEAQKHYKRKRCFKWAFKYSPRNKIISNDLYGESP